MVKKRTIRITVATEETWLLRKSASHVLAWCDACAAEVRMLAAEKAAAHIGTSARAIYRAVENQTLHFKEAPDGRLFICLTSLTNLAGDQSSPAPLELKQPD